MFGDAGHAGTAYVDFHGDFSSLDRQVAAHLAPLTSRFGKLGKTAAVGLAGIATGGIAAGVALYKIGESFDEAYDTIRTKTGATGKHLDRLKKDFEAVVSDIPTDFKSAGDAVGGLNQRLGITGKPLRHLSKQVLELSRITGTDLEGNITTITRLFGDWGVKTRQQPKFLDKLFRASQATGIEVGRLSEYMVQFGSPLRQLGFDFDTSAAMFSKFEKEGVNLQTAMPGLRMALKNFAAEGRDPAKALEETIKQIKNAGSTAKANTMAFDIFGTRAGPDLAAAIREGRFDFADLIKEIDHGKSTILGTGKQTQDFSEKLQILRNKGFVLLEPIANRVFDALGKGLGQITDILGNKDLTGEEKFKRIADLAQHWLGQGLTKAADLAGKIAPHIAEAVVHGFLGASFWGKLAVAGWLISKFGGAGALTKVGQTIGGKTAKGAAGGLRGGLSKLGGMVRGVGATVLGVALAQGVAAGFAQKGNFATKFKAAVESIPGGKGLESLLGVGSISDAQKGNALFAELAIHGLRVAESLGHVARTEDDLRRIRRDTIPQLVAEGKLTAEQGAALQSSASKMATFAKGLSGLRSGLLSSADAQKVFHRNQRALASDPTITGKELRVKTTQNYLALAGAIKRGGINSVAELRRYKNALNQADLFGGQDPIGIARGFARSWVKARGFNRSQISGLVRDLNKMPLAARQKAAAAIVAMTQAAAQKNPALQGKFRQIRSALVAEVGKLKPDGQAKTGDALRGMLGTIGNFVDNFREKGGALGTAMINGMAEAAASGAEQLYKAGQDAAKSFADGVTEGAIAHPRLGSPRHTGKGHALGGKFDRATLGWFGEAGREYIIPVEGAHREHGRQLLMEAAQDLGVKVAAFAGGKRPGLLARKKKKGKHHDDLATSTAGQDAATAAGQLNNLLADLAKAELTQSDIGGGALFASPDYLNYWASVYPPDKFKAALPGAGDELGVADQLIAYWRGQVDHWNETQKTKIGEAWDTFKKDVYKGHGKNRRKVHSKGDEIRGSRHPVYGQVMHYDKLTEARQQVKSYYDYIAGLFEPLDTSTATPAAIDTSSIYEALRQANLRTAVSEASFDVLRNMPFGGSFADGGVVPGPRGAARLIEAHGGETVMPEGPVPASRLRVEVHDHTTRVFFDDKEIEAVVHRVNRKDGRRAGRGLPGNAGVLGG